MNRTPLVLFTAAAAALLTGCGASVPADGGTYKNVSELKDAFVKSGIGCEDWDEHNKSVLAASSGSCGEKYTIGVYDDPSNLKMQIEMFRQLEVNSVIGKNWVASGTNAKAVHEKLGGEIITK